MPEACYPFPVAGKKAKMSLFFILVILPCAFGPLVILSILLFKGKFSQGASIGDRILIIIPMLWILYGMSFAVFLVLGFLYYVFGGGR
jgi:hypothetical protein